MAMLALVVLITLIGTYVVSDALTRITAQVKIERDSRSLDAMQEAKAALIAWSASQAWTGNTTDQPGSLPCPDTTNDGSSDISGGACLSQVGRLPWKTLNARELRDASGEILWYALSPNLRNASGVTVINSDTQGQLVLYSDKDSTTTATLSNVVAFVIAPGVAVAGQTRNSSGVNTAANYLEGRNSGATGNYTSTPQSPASYPDTFNDQILPLTHSDLFSVVEQAVASRIESDIKQYIAPVSGSSITSYFSQWGGFPFPAIFSNATYTNGPGTSAQRAQTAYIGSTTTSTSGGLLPLTTTGTYTWTTGSATVTLTGGTAASISGTTCSLVTGGMQCDFNINPRLTGCCSYSMVNPQFRVSAPIANVGLGFVDLPDDVSTGLSPRVTVTNLTGTTRTMSGTSTTGSLSATGAGTVIFQGTHVRNSTSSAARAMRVTIPDVTTSSLTSSSDPFAGWFIRNEWYRQVYYAISPGLQPGGGGSCSALPATPSCLTVNTLPSSYASTTDKRVILILTGRSINGSSRPSATLSNYLEGQNTTPTDFIYEHRAGMASSINDRVVVIAP